MRRILTSLLLAVMILGISNLARAESGVRVDEPQVSHIFGEQITIQTQIHTDVSIRNLQVIIQPEDDSIIIVEQIPSTPEGEVFSTVDVSRHPIRAFSTLSIWFEVELENGTFFTSEPTTYFYDDNRFAWQSLETDEFHIHWYEGDTTFGQEILNVAYEGLQRIQSQINVPLPQGVEIYAYASALELQDTLLFSGESAAWVAGHADPDLEVIVVSLPPGQEQTLEIKRQLPHELVHVLLYKKLGAGYKNLPRWLNEGLASTAELSPNPDYQLLLDKAYDQEVLIPMTDLCQTFPIDAAIFQLSYAESTAFTWYLQQTFGNAKIEDLIRAYADGSSCEQGAETALGVPLSKLESNWRQVMFNENVALNAFIAFSPWLLVLVAVLAAPVGLMIAGVQKRRKRVDESAN